MSERKQTARRASPLEVLTKLANVEHNADLLTQVIPAAAARVDAMLEQRGTAPVLSAATESLIRKCYRGAVGDFRLAQAFGLDESITVATRDTMANLQWMHAEAGFALGLALGMRLGGGR